MRIIICGGGRVGYNLAAYLSRQKNDVTFIDNDEAIIHEINTGLDVNTILGSAANPNIQQQAGAGDADVIIAVTGIDEVNMVICQVAHSLFNVPKKIARIRQRAFRDQEWSNLFSRAHMPIDCIISPEEEIANDITNRLNFFGVQNFVSIQQDQAHIVSIQCHDHCPLLNTTISQLPELFPQVSFEIIAIRRQGRSFFPQESDQIFKNDQVFVLCHVDDTANIVSYFGYEQENEDSHTIIVGGGSVGRNLIDKLYEDRVRHHITVIEENSDRAFALSQDYEDVIVLNSSGLDRQSLAEAGVGSHCNLIIVTDDDETNILISLLARQFEYGNVMSLVNKNTYHDVVSQLACGSTISPQSVTTSEILRYLDKGGVRSVFSPPDQSWEAFEITIGNNSPHLGQKLGHVNNRCPGVIYALLRDEELIYIKDEPTLQRDDVIILLADYGLHEKINDYFTPSLNIF